MELKGRRPIKLPEVFVRPATDGKRLPGEVEIHQNGLRYVSMGSQKIGEDFYLSLSSHIFNGKISRYFVQQYQTPLLPAL